MVTPDQVHRSGRPAAPPARQEPAVEQVLDQLATGDTAGQEPPVVEEPRQTQQEQLRQLRSRYEAELRWRTQLSAVVPVGLCVTDGHGRLLDANPAMATHLGVGVHRLRGRPLALYLHPDDVRGFRSALHELAAGAAVEHRATVTIRPRQQDEVRAELIGLTEIPDPDARSARVQWVLVPARPLGGLPGGTATGTAAEAGTAGGTRTDSPTDPAAADGAETDDAPSLALAAALAELSGLPVGELDEQRLLSRMAALVRSAVPAASWVSITVGAPAAPQRLGSDSPQAQLLDGLQVQVQEGPCWDAFADGRVVVTGDVTTDQRWPQLAALALGGDVRSVVALPVQESGRRTGVVNIYSTDPNAFGASAWRIAELVAAAVTGVLQTVAERSSLQALARHLEQALTSRAVIDQAKGVLMAHLGVDADEAFARLVALSSQLNVKVRDLARLVVEGDAATVLAALPPDPPA